MRYTISVRWLFKLRASLADQLAVANMLICHYFDPRRLEDQLNEAQKGLLDSNSNQQDSHLRWREVQFLRYNQTIHNLDYDPPLNIGSSRGYKSLYFETLEDMHYRLVAQQKGGASFLPIVKGHASLSLQNPTHNPDAIAAGRAARLKTSPDEQNTQQLPLRTLLLRRAIEGIDWLFHKPPILLAVGLAVILIGGGIRTRISRDYAAYYASLDHQAIEMRSDLELYKPGWLPTSIPASDYQESSANWQLHRLYSGESNYLILSQYEAQPEYDASHSAAWRSDSKAEVIELGEQDAMILKKGNRIRLNLELGSTGITVDTNLPEEEAIHIATSLTRSK